MRYALLLFILMAAPAFAQVTVDVEQFAGIKAAAVKVEPTPSGVLVFVTDPEPGTKFGAWLRINSPAKWATPYCEGCETGQATDGRWYLIPPKPGTYSVLIIEFDPEKGPRITSKQVAIGNGPIPPPPVGGDLSRLTKAAKDAADALDDAATRKALATAYITALELMPGKSYDEAKRLATQARFAALNARAGASRLKDWSSWLAAVDAVLGQLVKPGDAEGYRAAIDAIAKGLN